MKNRKADLDRFYQLLNKLKHHFPERKLAESNGRMKWPKKGVYFFFEKGENRENGEPRVVRVGTHGITKSSKSTLWNRLKAHKGTNAGYGNHRGSVFRKLIGQAIINKDNLQNCYPNWGKGSKAAKDIRAREKRMEKRVSEYLGQMPFLYLDVEEREMRKYIEQNAIALLSNKDKEKIDPASDNWLGFYSGHKDIRQSNLWNSRDVEKDYDPAFLNKLEELINQMIAKKSN